MKSFLKQRREQYQQQQLEKSSLNSDTGSSERNGMMINAQAGTGNNHSPMKQSLMSESASPLPPKQDEVVDMMVMRKLIFHESTDESSSDIDFDD